MYYYGAQGKKSLSIFKIGLHIDFLCTFASSFKKHYCSIFRMQLLSRLTFYTMSKNVKKNPVVVQADLLDKMDSFFEKHRHWLFWFGMAFAFLFSLLLFTLKMSEMGDDSGYVLRAYTLLKKGTFPSFQGPMYPMFLSVFMAVFGVKIVLFKALSMLLVLFALYLFYKSLESKIPYSLLIPAFILTATNSYILYFSSQTFSEAPYLFLQALFFWILFRKGNAFEKDFQFKTDWKNYLIIGLVLFAGMLTRSVHLGALVALVFFFLIIGKWKSALASLGGYGVFYFLFEGVKRIFWHNDLAQIAAQGNMMLQKNPYNAHEGLETFPGYLDRLVGNSQYYISNAFYSMSGLREESAGVSGFLTLLTYALVFGALFLTFKKSKTLAFTVIYVGVLCLVTFIGLQTFWSQWRLIGVFYPFVLIAIFTFFYYGLKRFRVIQFIYPLLLVLLFFTGLGDTFSKAAKNQPILQANLAGDTFADYSPEWKSFMEMNKWVAKNIPAQYNVASRKPEMSFIYTGREFYGVYSLPEVSLDTLHAMIKPGKVVFGVDPSQLTKYPVFGAISKDVLCLVQASDNSFTGVYQMDAAKAANVLPELQAAGVPVEMNVVPLLDSKAQAGLEMHVINPEQLTQQFVRNNVRYVILNSQYLFTTMHRYLSFVQLKYPQSLSTVYATGAGETQTMLVEFQSEHLN